MHRVAFRALGRSATPYQSCLPPAHCVPATDCAPCRSYLRSNWNVLDGFVVIVSLVAIGLPSVKVLRSFRALRPLRVIVRSRNMRVRYLTCGYPPTLTHVTYHPVLYDVVGMVGCGRWSCRRW